MTVPPDKRYSDEETALVLKRAVELEARRTESGGCGQTLDEIKAIAAEVGIDPGLVDRAAHSLAERGPLGSGSLFGPGTVARVEAIAPVVLSRESQAALLSAVQDELAIEGIVTEALGSARWTNQSRFGATQVTLTPGDEGTRIEVMDRFTKRVPVALHAIPGFWGAILGHTLAVSVSLPGATASVLILGAAVLGTGLGHGIWHTLARRSRGKVRGVLDRLSKLAERSAGGSRAGTSVERTSDDTLDA